MILLVRYSLVLTKRVREADMQKNDTLRRLSVAPLTRRLQQKNTHRNKALAVPPLTLLPYSPPPLVDVQMPAYS